MPSTRRSRGTTGEAPDAITLVQSVSDAEAVQLDGTRRLAYLTQTTLSVDETREIVGVLKRRYPSIVGPRKDDICYATQNRQDAVKALLPDVDVVLVIGSANSSNSNRLVEVATARGVPAFLIEDASGPSTRPGSMASRRSASPRARLRPSASYAACASGSGAVA